MKATATELAELKGRIADAVGRNALTRSEIGQLSSVHPSQVSRICRGDFRTISHNVVQVCTTLGLQIDRVTKPAAKEDAAWAKIEASARGVWDKSPEGAERIARILETIKQLTIE